MGKGDFDLTINVMMVGGRRCGKTSILAATQKCFEDQFSGTPLMMGPANLDMLDILDAKQQEMIRYFLERGKNRAFSPDNTPTEEIMEYPFYIGLKDKKSRICVKFIDYPGEWLTSKEHREALVGYMKKSRIFLVAIDTPHLIEEKGLYNEPKNLCLRVSEMVKSIGFADIEKGPGMVLFVPLKCERYYHAGEMDKVAARVQEAYNPLLQYLLKPGAEGKVSQTTVAVTPILTMGGTEFSRFQWDDNGEIEVDAAWGTPQKAIYHFTDMTKDAPEPKYCDQPLVYVLYHILEQAKQKKSGQKFGNPLFGLIQDFVQSSILKWPSKEDYLAQTQEIQKKLKQTGDGYCILSNGILKFEEGQQE